VKEGLLEDKFWMWKGYKVVLPPFNLNPEPWTPNPEPQTLNPEPYTPNPEP
jgi:hypothetical protein